MTRSRMYQNQRIRYTLSTGMGRLPYGYHFYLVVFNTNETKDEKDLAVFKSLILLNVLSVKKSNPPLGSYLFNEFNFSLFFQNLWDHIFATKSPTDKKNVLETLFLSRFFIFYYFSNLNEYFRAKIAIRLQQSIIFEPGS
jgi:hypothetical protein